MSDIRNISGLRHLEKKRLHKKISFSEGEIIRAKVKNSDGSRNIQLRTVDGWEFEGELDKSIDADLNEKFLRFVVKGFKNGKLQLSIAEGISGEGEGKSSIEAALEKLGVKGDPKTLNILKLMIKLKMPLNKENLSTIKSLLEFQRGITENTEGKEKFAEKFLELRGLNNQGERTENLKGELSKAFTALSKLDSKTILFMMKNKISFTSENIEAFKSFATSKESIYDIVKEMSKFMDKNKLIENEIDLSKYLQANEKTIEQNVDANKNVIQNAVNNYSAKDSSKMDFIEKMISDILSDVDGEDFKKLKEIHEEINYKDIEKSSEKAQQAEKKLGEMELDFTDKSTSKAVKENINKMLKDSREILKILLSDEKSGNSEEIEKLQGFIQKNLSKIRVFNSISNEYYYYDGPLKCDEKEYPFKFIIKDDRKKEKKIDSKNVKVVVSLTTKNVGKVDSYIQIYQRNLNIDIKCSKKSLKLMELSLSKLVEKFEESKYDLKVTVEERKEDVDIVNCNDFFEDDGFLFLNTKA